MFNNKKMKRRDVHQWVKERMRDPYFIKAKKEGYRARSAYKLIEIQEKFGLIYGKVLDLGCAPGAWLQVAKKYTKEIIYGVDLLQIEPINKVEFLHGDIFAPEIKEVLLQQKFHVILSDIFPNCSGDNKRDHFQLMSIMEQIEYLMQDILLDAGNCCLKIFEGPDFQDFFERFKSNFKEVKRFKPKASNLDSAEFYLIGKGYRKKEANKERSEKIQAKYL